MYKKRYGRESIFLIIIDKSHVLCYNRSMQYEANRLKCRFSVRDLYTIHYFKYAKNFVGPGEAHDFWELVYIDGGAAEIVAGERKILLKQGQMIFHKPNEFHNILTRNRFANSIILSFSCKGKSMQFFREKVFTLDEYERRLLEQIVLEGSRTFSDRLNDIYLMNMTKSENAIFGGEQMIKNLIEILLIALFRRNADRTGRFENTAEGIPERQVVSDISSILKNALYTPLTLDDVAAKLYFSKTYLQRIFRERKGVTIKKYYNHLKIEEAKKLLSEEKTATEIAELLNFGSIHYFCKCFKDATNLTPTEYARSTKLQNLIE